MNSPAREPTASPTVSSASRKTSKPCSAAPWTSSAPPTPPTLTFSWSPTASAPPSMPPESAKLLSDMRVCSQRIADYTSKSDLTQYLSSHELRDAVHWNFTIIGEALSQLSKL